MCRKSRIRTDSSVCILLLILSARIDKCIENSFAGSIIPWQSLRMPLNTHAKGFSRKLYGLDQPIRRSCSNGQFVRKTSDCLMMAAVYPDSIRLYQFR